NGFTTGAYPKHWPARPSRLGTRFAFFTTAPSVSADARALNDEHRQIHRRRATTHTGRSPESLEANSLDGRNRRRMDIRYRSRAVARARRTLDRRLRLAPSRGGDQPVRAVPRDCE